jgi:SAM-dependent methyltransferase
VARPTQGATRDDRAPQRGSWPKTFAPLTAEQERIRDDFVRHWHEVLPKRYGAIERFNHGFPATTAASGLRTLEIGAGLGEHLHHEQVEPGSYVTLELREEMGAGIRREHPGVEVVIGDCQERLPFSDASFDRVLAIHVLEHLTDLPSALDEVRRVLRPDGQFVVVIPCEGSLAYTLARRFSAQRIFEKRYGTSYSWFIEREHVNIPSEIIPEMDRRFTIQRRRFFPLRVPSVAMNLVVGLVAHPRSTSPA